MEPQRHFVNENIFCAPVKGLLIEKLKALSYYLNYLYLGKKNGVAYQSFPKLCYIIMMSL